MRTACLVLEQLKLCLETAGTSLQNVLPVTGKTNYLRIARDVRFGWIAFTMGMADCTKSSATGLSERSFSAIRPIAPRVVASRTSTEVNCGCSFGVVSIAWGWIA